MAINEDDLDEMLDGEEDKHLDRKCPLDKTSIPAFMLDILRVKANTLSDSLKLASDLFKIVGDESEKKKEVYTFIKRIMTETYNTIDQFDYLTAMVEGDDSDDGGEEQ